MPNVPAKPSRLSDSVTFFANALLSRSNRASGKKRPTHSTNRPSIVTYDARNSSDAFRMCSKRRSGSPAAASTPRFESRIAALSRLSSASWLGNGQVASGKSSWPCIKGLASGNLSSNLSASGVNASCAIISILEQTAFVSCQPSHSSESRMLQFESATAAALQSYHSHIW